MGVIKSKDIWNKSVIQFLDWETFSASAPVSRPGREAVPAAAGGKAQAVSEEDKKKAQADRDALIAEARARAEQIVAQAEDQARTIKDEAYQKGLEEGVFEAEKKALEKYSVQFSQEVAKVVQIADALQTSYSDIVRKAESSLVKLALEVAQKIIREECGEKESVVRNMIREGLSRAGEKPVLRIRVNPAQLPAAQAHRSEFEAQLKDARNLEITADESISQGGCVIETDSGSIDLRIEKQFAEIKESLTGEGKVDGTV